MDGTTARLLEYFDAHPQHRAADAVVPACFSAPGLHAMRETLPGRVWGSAECAYLTAGAMVERFGVVELSREDETFSRMSAVGRTLGDRHGARLIVMGCAGMARYRDRLEDLLDVPVIDPTQAAAMALGQILARLD